MLQGLTSNIAGVWLFVTIVVSISSLFLFVISTIDFYRLGQQKRHAIVVVKSFVSVFAAPLWPLAFFAVLWFILQDVVHAIRKK